MLIIIIKVFFDSIKDIDGELFVYYEILRDKKSEGCLWVTNNDNPLLYLLQIQEYNPDNEPEDDCL